MATMEDGLLSQLRELGLGADSYRAVALLPLIQVAWADGRVQPAEARAIQEIARQQGLVPGGAGQALLERWLRAPPPAEEVATATHLLVELARRQGGAGASLDAGSLQDLIALCERVAGAAGGLLGLSDPISSAERAAIAEIARVLSIDTGQSWVELARDLG